MVSSHIGNSSVTILIEPRQEADTAAVREKLRDMGARDVQDISPGFISAVVPEDQLDDLRVLARVSPVARKAMTTRGRLT